MVKDGQVVRLRQLLRPSTTLKQIALQANMDTKTARKYVRLSTFPSENHRIREWRTRTDPLAGVWEEVAGQLQRNPTTSATAVLSALQVADPESLSKTQLRTLQRRVREWRAAAAKRLVFGTGFGGKKSVIGEAEINAVAAGLSGAISMRQSGSIPS